MSLEKMFPHPQSFIVEFDDGQKVPVDSGECHIHFGTKAETIVHNAIYKAKKSVPYKERDTFFIVKIWKLEIEGGKLKTTLYQTLNTKYSHDDMTEDEFFEQMHNLLEPLPSQFKCFVWSEAWERGHSAGYQEVVCIAGDLVDKLAKYINEYKKDLKIK